ncbi:MULTISPECIES: flagellar biosynthetic protein FliR [Exiguobacterium]|uniref:Flagellar biosynthetic protein FliR n=1 Tax=Exiguobacterium antarcticum TaxID=132920 RepID=A0ABT6QYV3_9BACL|nr:MULTISPECIES: flagellar biosynthetic protein FliR [Exiguobacterium]AFS70821.1 Flagellar biosynthetic protein fliR [Exiguobacterium antarcticum B7]MCT4779684.1 flagellar biosynthetic protein FliR [Exiguobacterium soli]MDI3233866.1 flagellar biosynthetic protein FliR [Exiguobacterium antarcticum]OIN67906.1 flagellar biosynthetic protein FliR [Exiguobacterium sp. KRL4]
MTLLSFVSVFLLVFGRIVGFLVAAPLFSSKQLPAQHKLAIAAGLAYFASYAVKTTVQVDDIDFFFRMGTEVIIGLALGLLASFLLYAPQIAGSIIDLQMGLAMASAYDPMFGGQSPIIGRFYYMLTLLVLLASDMHLILLDGIYTSFEIFPPGSPIGVTGEAGMSLVVRVIGMAMLTALQMAMPLVVSLFLVDLALGFLAKTAPQFNIFAIGFSVKLLMGYAILFLLAGAMITGISRFVPLLQEVLSDAIQLLGG